MKISNLLFASFILLLTGCDNNSPENFQYENDSSPSNVFKEENNSLNERKDAKDFANQGTFLKKPINNGINVIKELNRKIIWKGELKFQVKEVNSSSEKITKITEDLGGFISDMNLTSSNRRITNSITIRISNDKFQSLLNKVKGQSIFTDYANINSNDVTAEFIDIESRLKTKKEVRERYINILRNKTGKIKDVIAAEEAIRVITEEIEAKEGRLRYLKDKVEYSTVMIELYQKVAYKSDPEINQETPFSEKFGNSFDNGWKAIKGLFLLLVTIWPILFLGIITWFIFRKKKRNKAN